jgi:hypothetical protein
VGVGALSLLCPDMVKGISNRPQAFHKGASTTHNGRAVWEGFLPKAFTS